MGSISLLQWRKAYMLEFMNGDTVVDTFTFSVPPENEELHFSQRITETKTFGGSVFDDYGNDSYKITLSGSTINEDKKFIYKGKKAPQYLTGTKEIFELQKIITNWGNNEYSSGFFRKGSETAEDKKVYLYDLSKMSILQIAAGTASRNWWRVFIKDFKIKRDKSKPNTYNYTLEMIGIDENTKKKAGGLLSGMADFVNKAQDVVDGIQTVADLTEVSTESLKQVTNYVEKAMIAATAVKNRDVTGGLVALSVGSAVDVVSRIFGGDSNTFYNCAKNVCESVSAWKNIKTDKDGKVQSTSKFTVTFNSNGGSEVKYQSIEYCKTVSKPIDPTKEDFTFSGWYKNSSLTEEYDFSKEVTSDFTLYAKWTLAVATVTYNSRNGSPVTPQKVAVGTATTKPTDPTRNGYRFNMWCTDYDCTIPFNFSTPITNNITLYAAWIKTCTITFNVDGGTEIAPQVVDNGGLVVYPKTPTKENYTFACWCIDSELINVFDFSTPVVNDMTLYACYVQISNKVTFNSNGGTNVESQTVVIGGHAIKPVDPTKEGFDFVHWCDDISLTNEFRFNTTEIIRNTTLYAKWTETLLDVIFDSMGGSPIETQRVGYNNKAIFPEIPTKENCSFIMWQTRKEIEADSGEADENGNPVQYVYEEFDFSTPIKESVTLYAKWLGVDE